MAFEKCLFIRIVSSNGHTLQFSLIARNVIFFKTRFYTRCHKIFRIKATRISVIRFFFSEISNRMEITRVFRVGSCGLLVTNETVGTAVSSVGDLLEFGVGDLVDMFSVTQKQIRTITVGSMDSTIDEIFSKLDGRFSIIIQFVYNK